MNKKELWLKIANYHFDHLVPTHLLDEIAAKFGGQNPSTKAFADKISRKLNWKKKFAMKSISEYKKFIFLGVVADFSVTPSKIIDQVWHEHLLFSAGYRKFCNEIIQCDFDHNPELISMNIQTEGYQTQYYHTIELYKKEFGFEPPAEIWDITKFKEKKEELKSPINMNNDNSYYDSNYERDGLFTMFSAEENNGFDGFDGGSFGGGGASGEWNNTEDDSSDDDTGDSSDSDSSCSSSCGGD